MTLDIDRLKKLVEDIHKWVEEGQEPSKGRMDSLRWYAQQEDLRNRLWDARWTILDRLAQADRFEEALRQIVDESTGVDEDLNAGDVWCLEAVASIARATLNGEDNAR